MVAGVHGHIDHCIAVVFALRLADDLSGHNVVHIGSTVFTACHEVLVAVAHREPDTDTPVLVATSKLLHRVGRSQVPQFDCVVRCSGQERIQAVGVAVGPLIKLDCVRVSLMRVVHRANRFVHISVKYDDLLVGSSQNPYLARSFGIVQREGADRVG